VRIPDGVRETIGRRLSRLSDRCNELLTIASVLGRNFSAQELAAAADCDLDGVLMSIDAAVRSGIVEACDEPAGGYRFAHALIRETLYDEIPALDRLRLHGRAGDTLASVHSARLDSVLTRIAHHYYEAAPLGNALRAADFAMRAGENAARMYAYEEALVYCDRAIDALALNPLEDDSRLARAYLLKGFVQGALADPCAPEALHEAVKHALRLGDAELLVEITTRLVWTTQFAPQQQVVPLLEKALALLSEAESVARAKALAALAFALRSAGDSARIGPLVAEALTIAERQDDAFVLCSCLQLSIMALRGQPQLLDRRLTLGRRFIEVARNAGDKGFLADAYSWHALSLIEAAQIDELETLLGRYEDLQDVVRSPLHEYMVRADRITLALLRGEWSGLEARIEELLQTGMKTRRQDAEGVYGAQMFALNRDLGRLAAVEPAVRKLASSSTAWTPGLLAICTELGLLDAARRLLERLAHDHFAAVPKDEMYVACLVFCAEACCKLNDVGRAAAVYELLTPYAEQTANHPRAVCFGAVALHLANARGHPAGWRWGTPAFCRGVASEPRDVGMAVGRADSVSLRQLSVDGRNRG
jgi:tetratricopeptide (TPR) repeat protein